jgi:hypothetical protein
VDITTLCFICHQPCSLEECKIDEIGNAVHEKCYAVKVTGPEHREQRRLLLELLTARGRERQRQADPAPANVSVPDIVPVASGVKVRTDSGNAAGPFQTISSPNASADFPIQLNADSPDKTRVTPPNS